MSKCKKVYLFIFNTKAMLIYNTFNDGIFALANLIKSCEISVKILGLGRGGRWERSVYKETLRHLKIKHKTISQLCSIRVDCIPPRNYMMKPYLQINH